MTNIPVLAQPNLKKTFILQTDAFNEGLKAVLAQKDKNNYEYPVAYAS